MKITEQRFLNKGEMEQVRQLLMRCHKKEDFSVSFPLAEPRTKYFTARTDDNQIVSVLALCRLDKTEYEVSALTDPDCRQKGYFKILWEKAQRALPGTTLKSSSASVRFALDSACKDALPVLRSIGAKLSEEETEMKCDLSGKEIRFSGNYSFRKSKPSAEGVVEYMAVSKADNRPVMRCFLMPMKDRKCYLHRISVRSDLIGQNVGSEVFPEILSVLKKEGYVHASLQVTSSNIPAVRLYANNGFETTLRLKYYEIDFE